MKSVKTQYTAGGACFCLIVPFGCSYPSDTCLLHVHMHEPFHCTEYSYNNYIILLHACMHVCIWCKVNTFSGKIWSPIAAWLLWCLYMRHMLLSSIILLLSFLYACIDSIQATKNGDDMYYIDCDRMLLHGGTWGPHATTCISIEMYIVFSPQTL